MPDEAEEKMVCDRCESECDCHTTVYLTCSGSRGDRGSVEYWCDTCVSDHALYCDGYRKWFHSGNVEFVECRGDMYSYEYATNNLYHWDGEWHFDPEPELEDEDIDPDSNNIPGYHSVARDYDVIRGSEVYGVELEVYCNDGNRGYWFHQAKDRGLIIEEDGSLDGDRGMEIVGPPLPLSSYLKSKCPWLWALKNIDAKGWNADGCYGMHVSANRSSMTDDTLAKVIVFVNHNPELAERVAGRTRNSYCKYENKRRGEEITSSRDHYSAVSVTSKRVEFRIFRSNMLPEGFMKNIEFVDACIKFCKQTAFDDLKPHKFCEFIRDNPLYVNLRSYLSDIIPSPFYKAESQRSRFGLSPHDAFTMWNNKQIEKLSRGASLDKPEHQWMRHDFGLDLGRSREDMRRAQEQTEQWNRRARAEDPVYARGCWITSDQSNPFHLPPPGL